MIWACYDLEMTLPWPWNNSLPSKHKTYVWHFALLDQRLVNVMQMLCVYWVGNAKPIHVTMYTWLGFRPIYFSTTLRVKGTPLRWPLVTLSKHRKFADHLKVTWYIIRFKKYGLQKYPGGRGGGYRWAQGLGLHPRTVKSKNVYNGRRPITYINIYLGISNQTEGANFYDDFEFKKPFVPHGLDESISALSYKG